MSIDSTLYVQSVPAGVTQAQFEAAVTGAAKEVSRVSLNERKRYAHVVFESHEAAEKGIKSLKKASIGGEHLEFDWSKAKESSKPEFDEASNKTVSVSGLSTSTEKEEVETAFSDYGEIERVFIVNNQATKTSAGKAIVEFKTRAAAEKALELNETELGGQTITVEFAKAPRAPKKGGRPQTNGGASKRPAQKRKADDDEEEKPAKKAKSTETKKDSAASTKKDTPKKETAAPSKKDTPKKETAASPKKETPKKAATPSKAKGKK